MSEPTFEEMQSWFLDGMRRDNKLMLDNAGICIKMSELPSIEKYREMKRICYGTHWMSRLWANKLRPHLAPKQDAKVWSEYRTMRGIMYVELLEETIRRGEALGYMDI